MRRPSGPRVRARTPPRIKDHKPPKPKDPPPNQKPAVDEAVAPKVEKRSSTGSGTASLTTGYMTKKGEVANIFTGNKWKKRWFVLEKGELTYYTDKSAWERGEKPLKGHRIELSHMTVRRETEGADIALEPREATAGVEERIWQFICDSKAEIDRWVSAFIAHGGTSPTVIRD